VSGCAAAPAAGLGWWFHLKMLARSAFNGVLQVLWPLFFATIAFLMYALGVATGRCCTPRSGASVMGVWSAVSTSASGCRAARALVRHPRAARRRARPAAAVLLPITDRDGTVGLYAMVATLLWGRFLFGIDVTHRAPTAVRGLGAGDRAVHRHAGLSPQRHVVRYRSGWALGNAFELPVWLVCGFLVPIGILPDWVRPISWVLAPTWGVRAIRESALGGQPAARPRAVPAVGLAYLAIGCPGAESVLARPAGTRRWRFMTAVVNAARIFVLGGIMSYRALFNWLRRGS
jgi:ABC-2 type transport system permease protein